MPHHHWPRDLRGRGRSAIPQIKYIYLVLALTAYYLAVVASQGFFHDPEAYLLRFAPDSAEYLQVAEGLWHFTAVPMVERRTFLYPLLLGLFSFPFGVGGLWLAQMFCWVGSALLFYVNLNALVREARLRLAGLVGFCLVWTPILLTLLALTESLALLLFSLLAFVLVQRRSPAFGLVLCGLLTVVKPNYGPLLYAFALGLLVSRAVPWRNLVGASVLCALLALMQVGLVYAATGRLRSTNMANNVLQLSLYSQVLAKVEHLDFMQVRAQSVKDDVAMSSMVDYLRAHPRVTLACFAHNLEENIRSVLYLDADLHPVQNFWRKILNSLIYWLHILFALPTLWALWQQRKMATPRAVTLWLLAVTFWASVLPTGVTFWAADRWTAPLLGVWPLLYILVASELLANKVEHSAKAVVTDHLA